MNIPMKSKKNFFYVFYAKKKKFSAQAANLQLFHFELVFQDTEDFNFFNVHLFAAAIFPFARTSGYPNTSVNCGENTFIR